MNQNYRQRDKMFDYDAIRGLQPFVSTGDISLTSAITDRVYPMPGDFLYIDQASTGVVSIELNSEQGGTLAPILLAAGGSIEVPFSSFKINSAAQLGKTVKIIIGNGARIKSGGTVNSSSNLISTVDGSRSKTFADKAFLGSAWCGGVAAQYAHSQLWNPATSGVKAIVKTVFIIGGGVTTFTLGNYNLALSTSLGQVPSKRVTASATAQSNAQLRTQNAAAPAVGYTYQTLGNPGTYTFKFDLQEPIVLEPGAGLVVINNTVNQQQWIGFEFTEE